MLEHGEYRLEWSGQVLHNYPVGGFNEFGIDSMRDRILEVVGDRNGWAFFEHPRDNAGLTPEAVPALCRMHQALIRQGCVAIGLEIGVTFGGVIRDQIFPLLSVPAIVDEDPAIVEHFLEQAVTEAAD